MTLCRPVLALVIAALTCVSFDSLEAGQQDPHTPEALVRALRVAEPPTIDGQLSEEAWTRAEPATNLTQRDLMKDVPRQNVRSSGSSSMTGLFMLVPDCSIATRSES